MIRSALGCSAGPGPPCRSAGLPAAVPGTLFPPAIELPPRLGHDVRACEDTRVSYYAGPFGTAVPSRSGLSYTYSPRTSSHPACRSSFADLVQDGVPRRGRRQGWALTS